MCLKKEKKKKRKRSCFNSTLCLHNEALADWLVNVKCNHIIKRRQLCRRFLFSYDRDSTFFLFLVFHFSVAFVQRVRDVARRGVSDERTRVPQGPLRIAGSQADGPN